MRYRLLLLLILTAGSSFAQKDICIGKRYGIYSALLREEREYQVYLPPSYDEDSEAGRTYPVIYLIDGDYFFETFVGIHRALSRGLQPLMPETIIVGIINKNRTYDLTPTPSAYNRNGTKQENDPEEGGGAEMFFRFLNEELHATIDKTYRTNGENTLAGHSFGGLFVMNTFLKHTDAFDTYIAIDPSLWWDRARLASEAANILQAKHFVNKTLYIAVARKIFPDRRYIHLRVMEDFLNKDLPIAEKNGLKYYYQNFSDENHGSIPLPGMIDAIKRVYTQEKKID